MFAKLFYAAIDNVLRNLLSDARRLKSMFVFFVYFMQLSLRCLVIYLWTFVA